MKNNVKLYSFCEALGCSSNPTRSFLNSIKRGMFEQRANRVLQKARVLKDKNAIDPMVDPIVSVKNVNLQNAERAREIAMNAKHGLANVMLSPIIPK